jgi:protein-disulfide isomerase
MRAIAGSPTQVRWLFLLVFGVAMLAIALPFWQRGDRTTNARMTPVADRPPSGRGDKPESIPLEGAVTIGRRDARIACVQYVDFQSGLSRMWSQRWLGAVITNYVDTGKLLVAFRCVRSEPKRAWALQAAKAAYCSAQQGKFWDMYALLMNARFEDQAIDEAARKIRLRESSFTSCREGMANDEVKRDELEASMRGVAVTPTFMCGTLERDNRVLVTRRVTGAIHFDEFARIIDTLLNVNQRETPSAR